MPFATFTKVREVSSEDDVHLAENLIKSQPGKKWKTKNAGEKSAYVILEMSECHQITGIDIGNEHSAFVEVLVGKSSCAPEDFTEILITCSFMTPTESKSSNNINRVRCFNREALVPTVASNKWSLVKILCTQPFNKHVSYGLSFIKIHINDEKKNVASNQKSLVPEQFLNKTTQFIGKLKLREDSPDSESENSSSLFNRWKKTKDGGGEQTAAASIRIASKSPMTLLSRQHQDVRKPQSTNEIKKDISIRDRNRENLLFGDDDEDAKSEKLERLSAQIEVDKERRRMEIEKEINKNKRKSLDVSKPPDKLKNCDEESTKPSTSKKHSTNNEMTIKKPKSLDISTSLNNSKVEDNKLTLSSSSKRPSSSTSPENVERVKKRQSSPPENPLKKMKSMKKYKPFNQLLSGVVLVISGIQNPDRADLRNKAIALGAKYKADWDNTCTHLICAFKNTPKYNQVKGKGKIVTRSWIEKCYSTKKYLPWRRFALDSKELSKPESDEEIFDESQKIETDKNNVDSLAQTSRKKSEDTNNTLALYDLDNQANSCENKNNYSSSESDTDDEINRINQRNELVEKAKVNKEENEHSEEKAKINKVVDIYDASTDEEDYVKEKHLQKKII